MLCATTSPKWRTHAHYMQKISVLSVYHRKSFEDFLARRLNENDKTKSVTLATFFNTKIRRIRIAFLLLLECSRSASLLLSRTTASPASWLPAAILDSATCRLMKTQQQKRLKQKKCCTCFFLNQRQFNEHLRLAYFQPTEQLAFHVSEMRK